MIIPIHIKSRLNVLVHLGLKLKRLMAVFKLWAFAQGIPIIECKEMLKAARKDKN